TYPVPPSAEAVAASVDGSYVAAYSGPLHGDGTVSVFEHGGTAPVWSTVVPGADHVESMTYYEDGQLLLLSYTATFQGLQRSLDYRLMVVRPLGETYTTKSGAPPWVWLL